MGPPAKPLVRKKYPNLAQIARDFGVSYHILHRRFRRGRGPTTATKPANKTLEPYQEDALISLNASMRDINLPVTRDMLRNWANRSLVRAGRRDTVVKCGYIASKNPFQNTLIWALLSNKPKIGIGSMRKMLVFCHSGKLTITTIATNYSYYIYL